MFSSRLKELRSQSKYTQEKIAEILKISRVAYTKYESGENMPTPDNLEKLADIFNVSIDYLLGRTNNPHPYHDLNEQVDIEIIVRELLSDAEMCHALQSLKNWTIDEKNLLITIIEGQKLLKEKQNLSDITKNL
ncbi:helix-turn-helix domain-containing protein [Alkalibaculum sp. M08DMB]|uniref:Helix-turn-helix domain-containing protein n=1 Tax=Alkalibaculum sporogenes TaxID=2655001 RepID=A0A6A7K9I9_9FIRM|nr:helix-turn-helix domain-containing protein [Alkalibaculum sporogenes]MPW26148.1 helix-turn-helix domain-containing protein [Alkalibaculum sporogenes]